MVTGHWWIPLTKLSVEWIVEGRRFDKPWCSCDVTLMIYQRQEISSRQIVLIRLVGEDDMVPVS